MYRLDPRQEFANNSPMFTFTTYKRPAPAFHGSDPASNVMPPLLHCYNMFSNGETKLNVSILELIAQTSNVFFLANIFQNTEERLTVHRNKRNTRADSVKVFQQGRREIFKKQTYMLVKRNVEE